MKSQKFRFTVGIDAGKTTGIGIYDGDLNRVTFAGSTDFHGALEFVKKLDPATHKIVVEIPGKFVYARHNDRAGVAANSRIRLRSGFCRAGWAGKFTA